VQRLLLCEPLLADSLASDAAGYNAARHFKEQQRTIAARHLSSFVARNIKDILRQFEGHGVDHRNPMNQTPTAKGILKRVGVLRKKSGLVMVEQCASGRKPASFMVHCLLIMWFFYQLLCKIAVIDHANCKRL
jgi:hypothetical protein